MMSNFLSCSYTLYIRPLSDVELVKILSHPVCCYFVLLMVPFALQNPFNFMRSNLFIVDISACAISVLFREIHPTPMCSRLFPNSFLSS